MSHPVNFSKDTLPKQWQYVKRNLREMGIRQEAIRRFRLFVHKWRNLEPKAVKCFQDEFYHTLNFYDFPTEVRSAISTTNYLERFLEEIRRRIKIQGYFKNERSLNLWIFGLIKHIKLNPIQQPKGYASKQKCEILLA
jgi:transposase-like protein